MSSLLKCKRIKMTSCETPELFHRALIVTPPIALLRPLGRGGIFRIIKLPIIKWNYLCLVIPPYQGGRQNCGGVENPTSEKGSKNNV